MSAVAVAVAVYLHFTYYLVEYVILTWKKKNKINFSKTKLRFFEQARQILGALLLNFKLNWVEARYFDLEPTLKVNKKYIERAGIQNNRYDSKWPKGKFKGNVFEFEVKGILKWLSSIERTLRLRCKILKTAWLQVKSCSIHNYVWHRQLFQIFEMAHQNAYVIFSTA